MEAFVQLPAFSELDSIARNLDEVSLVDSGAIDSGILCVTCNRDVVTWHVGTKKLVFPKHLVRSISVKEFEHCGNTFAGLVVEFSSRGKIRGYRMISAHVTCTPWLEHAAKQISGVIGLDVA